MNLNFEDRFLTFISDHALFNQEKPIIVGLSGGKDSMVLVHLLHKFNYPLIAAHCNFQLRSDDADLDQQLVEKWCGQNSVKCVAKRFYTGKYARENGVSVEMAARELRYNWFEELLLDFDAQAIAVGHHLDDQVETFLMNITRGTGFRGLSGIKVKNNQIVRPLLFASRTEIEQYAYACDIPFRDDHTNNDVTIKRNFFRHEIIPQFESVNPSFKRTVESNIEKFQAIGNYFDILFHEMEEELVETDGDEFTVKIATGKKQHIYLDFLHFLFDKKGIKCGLQPINHLLNAQVGSHAHMGDYVVIRDRDCLAFNLFRNYKVDAVLVEKLPAEITFGKYVFRFSALEQVKQEDLPKESEKVWLSADQIEWPIVIRSWQPGDRMKPFGMSQSRKIKKMLTDAKISSAQRTGFPLITDQKNIVWLPFVRPSQDYAVTHLSHKVVQIEVAIT